MNTKDSEEQIKCIQQRLHGFIKLNKTSATVLHDEGVRVIAPDEYVVKALTDEQVSNLVFRSTASEMDAAWLIDAVQRELKIEV